MADQEIYANVFTETPDTPAKPTVSKKPNVSLPTAGSGKSGVSGKPQVSSKPQVPWKQKSWKPRTSWKSKAGQTRKPDVATACEELTSAPEDDQAIYANYQGPPPPASPSAGTRATRTQSDRAQPSPATPGAPGVAKSNSFSAANKLVDTRNRVVPQPPGAKKQRDDQEVYSTPRTFGDEAASGPSAPPPQQRRKPKQSNKLKQEQHQQPGSEVSATFKADSSAEPRVVLTAVTNLEPETAALPPVATSLPDVDAVKRQRLSRCHRVVVIVITLLFVAMLVANVCMLALYLVSVSDTGGATEPWDPSDTSSASTITVYKMLRWWNNSDRALGSSASDGFMVNVASMYRGGDCEASSRKKSGERAYFQCQYALDARGSEDESNTDSRTRWATVNGPSNDVWIKVTLMASYRITALELIQRADAPSQITALQLSYDGSNHTDNYTTPLTNSTLSHNASSETSLTRQRYFLPQPISTRNVTVSVLAATAWNLSVEVDELRLLGSGDFPSSECCPNNLHLYDRHQRACYEVLRGLVPVDKAVERCHERGGELMSSFNSQSECLFLLNSAGPSQSNFNLITKDTHSQTLLQHCKLRKSGNSTSQDHIRICKGKSFCPDQPQGQNPAN